LKQLPPGHYLAYAFETVELGALNDPAVLKEIAGKGVDVTVKENDKKQIQLQSITADEMNAVFTKLSIDLSQN
jgi:hypothetical protein